MSARVWDSSSPWSLPHRPHRPNRRRQRPGSCSRRVITHIQGTAPGGIYDTRDVRLYLSSKATPSDLQQSLDCNCVKFTATDAGEDEQLEQERRRLFGGVVGDDISLCGSMLEVVLHLFGGLDYADPDA
jgi:hypothetical protein